MIPLPFDPPAGPLGQHAHRPQPQPTRGTNFAYLLPPGWRTTEEGPYALVLHAPDSLAGIIVFGQSGLMFPMSPDQFAYQAMTQVMRLAPDVRFSNARPAPVRPGYTQATQMDCTYTIAGPNGPVPLAGTVVSNVMLGYGHTGGTITIAAAEVRQWPGYQSWLPHVAQAAVNVGPNAYGSTSMANAMNEISQRDHAAVTAYQQHSQQTWQQVVDHRHQTVDRQQGQLDSVLTGNQWHDDPYGGRAIRRSTTPAVIWRSRDGREVSSDDPSYDPRTPMDPDWRRVR
jgi:hypothetical protein